MDFVLGRTRWHVIGYRNGNVYDWTTLCGWTPDDSALGGNLVDVVLSEMAVCGTCDRATGGQAKGDAELVDSGRSDNLQAHLEESDRIIFGRGENGR